MEDGSHTFLFADLAGYTALTEAHGDEHAAEVANDFCQSVRALLARHGATEVKTIGDAVMVHVGDPAAAVHVGRHIVDDLGSRHAFPTVRVGIHTGRAVERDGDWFGGAVNVAARVVGVAAEREVLVTDATRRAAAGSLHDLEFVPAGERHLKNVAEPVAVFRAVPEGDDEVEGLVIDPVCRMVIDPAQAAARIAYGGREYQFCSAECEEAFRRNPALYAAAAPSRRRRWLRGASALRRRVGRH